MSKYFIPTGCVGLSYSPVIHIKNAYEKLEAESKANTKLTRERGLNVNMRFKYAAVYLNERMYDTIIKLEEHTKRTDTYDKRMARFITKSKAEMTYYQRMLGKTFVALVVAPGVARMASQAPDVDGVTYVDCDEVGEFVNVRLEKVKGFDFIGVVV